MPLTAPLAHGDRVTVAGRTGRITAVTGTDSLIVATDDGDVIECPRTEVLRLFVEPNAQARALFDQISEALRRANDAAHTVVEDLLPDLPAAQIHTTLISSVVDADSHGIILHLSTRLPRTALLPLFEQVLVNLRSDAWDIDSGRDEEHGNG